MVSAPDYVPSRLVGAGRGTTRPSLPTRTNPCSTGRSRPPTGRGPSGNGAGPHRPRRGAHQPWTRFDCDRLIGCHGPHTQDTCATLHATPLSPRHAAGRDGGRRTIGSKAAADWTLEGTRPIPRFGTDLGGRLPGTSTGNVPAVPTTIASTGPDGGPRHHLFHFHWEGELLTTLQMANLAATLANRGTFRTPHFVRDVGAREAFRPGNPHGDRHRA